MPISVCVVKYRNTHINASTQLYKDTHSHKFVCVCVCVMLHLSLNGDGTIYRVCLEVWKWTCGCLRYIRDGAETFSYKLYITFWSTGILFTTRLFETVMSCLKHEFMKVLSYQVLYETAVSHQLYMTVWQLMPSEILMNVFNLQITTVSQWRWMGL